MKFPVNETLCFDKVKKYIQMVYMLKTIKSRHLKVNNKKSPKRTRKVNITNIYLKKYLTTA